MFLKSKIITQYLKKHLFNFLPFVMFFKRPVWGLPLALLVGGALLRLIGLNRSLGGLDENAMLMYFGYRPFSYIATHYFNANNHVFHTLLVHLMAVCFGDDNAIGIRFPNFIFGVASLWVIYLLALKIFSSRKVALVALLFSAISQVHVQFSQTVRGYGLIIFFSTLATYSLIHLLEKQRSWKWSGVFLISSVLSVYTIPTNLYFLLGLGAWTIAVLWIPRFGNEFTENYRVTNRYQIIVLYVVIALAILALYFPLKNQILNAIQEQNLHISQDKSSLELAFLLVREIFEIHLQGLQIWFWPFLIIGVRKARCTRNSYSLLPLLIFLFPVLTTLILGVKGFPRNYLFNFPFFMIFLSAGIFKTVEMIKLYKPRQFKVEAIEAALILVFVITGLINLLINYYPSKRVPDGLALQTWLKSLTKPEDLILIPDSRNFLYSRRVYRDRLQEIANQNSLSGVKLLVNDSEKIKGFKVSRGGKPVTIFNKNRFLFDMVGREKENNKFLVSLKSKKIVSLLPKDFESETEWNIVSGSGVLEKEKMRKIFGNKSLKLNASTQEGFTSFTVFPEPIHVQRPSVLVLVWFGRNLTGEMSINHPEISAIRLVSGAPDLENPIQLPLGESNDGINAYLKESPSWNSALWSGFSNLTPISPGNYSLSLWLKVSSDKRVLYDGFSAFLIELP